MFKRTQICTGVLLALGGAVLVTSAPAVAQQGQSVEVTGSRIKRADSEGALPVTVIKREELEASGAVTVAEFMRSSTFSSAGNFRPQSGSSAQSFASIDLRGLGAARTLVLLDGRRLPKGPQVGDSVDLNMVPMAAVERIEILTDGASAIYGSDAIGGVVNIISRKDYEGISLSAGYTKPSNKGGERVEASALLGVTGEKGRLIMGYGRTERAMVFTRDRPWGAVRGVSSFGNNYRLPSGAYADLGSLFGADRSLGCTDPNFYLTATTCSYDFNAVAADEARIESNTLFARGEHRINNDWTAYVWGSSTNTTSFGRYAPTPAQLTVQPGPNNPTAAPITVRHRTAAAGNRDVDTDNTLRDVMIGVQGKVAKDFEVDVGIRTTNSKYGELGRNYIVRPILEQYVNDGTYDLLNPNANDPAVLSAIKATIGRDSLYSIKEVFATGTAYNMFKTPGGAATLLLGTEYREEKYQDIYDSLSEAGVIEGSAGNSAGGTRKVASVTAEMLVPVVKGLEFTLAGRFEKYSDYGNDFAPKLSVRWQPSRSVTIRGSAGTGFRAPSLPIITQKTTFSAESVLDPATCRLFGGQGSILTPVTAGLTPANDCDVAKLVQVDTFTGANPSLKSEKSKQFAFGAVWDATDFLSVKADYYNIKIRDAITLIDAQDLIDRSNGSSTLPIPAGLGVSRNSAGAIDSVRQGYANEGTVQAEGIDLDFTGKWKLDGVGSFSHNLRYSHVLKYTINDDEQKGTLGLPKYRATLTNGWGLGPVSVAWNLNVIGKNGTAAGRIASTYFTNDIQLAYTTPWKGKLTVGVVNVGNKAPELVAYDGRNFNFYLYDSYGRQPYIRLEQKF